MKRILVCFAVSQEAAPFKPALGVHVLVTGMGASNVELGLPCALDRERPDAVFTCGFAGALDPVLPVGALLGATGDSRLGGIMEDADVLLRRFHCADRIAVTAAEKRVLHALTGCDAVEMESGHIQRLCRLRSIPCATIRTISDAAGDDLPLDFNRLLDSRQRLSPLRLAAAILRRPSSIAGLVRLGRHSKLAARNLALALSHITADALRLP
jgi:nucleoside phosphorylase